MPPRGAAVSVRRKRKPSEFHSEVTRERIRAGVIIDRFQKHFMGELDLTPTQIRVGEVLLRKVIPDLTHTDLSTTFTRRYVVEVPPQLSDEEWEKKYSLPAPALKSVQVDQPVAWSARGEAGRGRPCHARGVPAPYTGRHPSGLSWTSAAGRRPSARRTNRHRERGESG